MDADKPLSLQLPIRNRQLADGDGVVADALSVFCPARARSVSLDECRTCDHCLDVPEAPAARDAFVVCGRGRRNLEKLDRGATAVSRTPLSAVMARRTVCVQPELTTDGLVAVLLEHNLSGVPVVDADGCPIGVVSKSDLVRHGSTPSTVGEIMTPLAFTLPERAPLGHAAALMVVEGVHRVPIVSDDGQVVGILSALDFARWVAQQDGYVLPR
jgi:CBS domain-containing protein